MILLHSIKKKGEIMYKSIYYCTKENNNCDCKDKCERYVNCTKETSNTTLYKYSCTKNNNHILFIPCEFDTENKDFTENKEEVLKK